MKCNNILLFFLNNLRVKWLKPKQNPRKIKIKTKLKIWKRRKENSEKFVPKRTQTFLGFYYTLEILKTNKEKLQLNIFLKHKHTHC